MDNSIFLANPNLWQTVLDDLSVKAIMLRDKQYDAVFHLVTSAEGAEESFIENMKERKFSLSIEKAREMEKLYHDAWLGHPKR